MTNILQWPVKKITGAAVIDGMPNDDYHAHKSISSSGLRTIMEKCPSIYHFNSPHNPNPPVREYKPHFAVGASAHDFLLQRDDFMLHNFVLPVDFNPYTKAGKELKAEKLNDGFNVIKHEDFQKVKAMVAAIDAHPFAGAAFTDGVAERSIFWKDKETGVICRIRPDFLPNDFKNVPDYKTTADASPLAIQKSMANFGYHMQHAWYMEGIEAATGEKPQRFFFVFQEKEAPYITTCVVLDDDAIYYGQKQNRKALRLYAECLEKDVWPGYSEDVIVGGLPTWKLMQLDAMEQEGEL